MTRYDILLRAYFMFSTLMVVAVAFGSGAA
jgi:hypothetical protein